MFCIDFEVFICYFSPPDEYAGGQNKIKHEQLSSAGDDLTSKISDTSCRRPS